MNKKKSSLRERLLKERSGLDPSFVEQASQDIFLELVKANIWDEKKVVHVYLPIEKSKEIDTWPIVQWLIDGGHEVWSSYLPQDESKDGFCKISKTSEYKLGRYGIPIPLEKIEPDCEPDVIIAACVAADKQGNRLGHGNGWTDRFFARHPKALRVGLIYEQMLFDEIPNEPHDQTLDTILTEERTITIKTRISIFSDRVK